MYARGFLDGFFDRKSWDIRDSRLQKHILKKAAIQSQ